MSEIYKDCTSSIFFGDVEDRLGALVVWMGAQFIYTTVVWAVIIGDKPGSSMVQLFTFLLSLIGAAFLFIYLKNDENQDTMKKALPWVGMFWLLHSFTTWMCVFIHAIDKMFVDNAAGYIVILIFSTIFTLVWLQVTFALNSFAYKQDGSQARNDDDYPQ